MPSHEELERFLFDTEQELKRRDRFKSIGFTEFDADTLRETIQRLNDPNVQQMIDDGTLTPARVADEVEAALDAQQESPVEDLTPAPGVNGGGSEPFTVFGREDAPPPTVAPEFTRGGGFVNPRTEDLPGGF